MNPIPCHRGRGIGPAADVPRAVLNLPDVIRFLEVCIVSTTTLERSTVASSPLALLGGSPLHAGPLAAPPWPPVDEKTAQALLETYRSRQWSFNARHEQRFAREFAAYHGATHGIFMANGTVTLECALAAYDIGPGDEVIVPALTWMATAMAVHYRGAVPVFVDVEPTTLCLDPQRLAEALTPRTRAIIPVHLYGSMADMQRILAFAAEHDLVVIEDCAHAHGGKWDGRGVGSWGHVGSFSFQQSKSMASGEGGICITSDNRIAERLYRLKHIGYPPNSAQGEAMTGPPQDLVCQNFRGTEFQAVILQGQLDRLDDLMTRYDAAARRLEDRLGDLPDVRFQPRGRLATTQGYYAWFCILDSLSDVPAVQIQKACAAEGFNPYRTYGPVYQHMLFNLKPSQYRIAGGRCRVAEGPASTHAIGMLHHWLGADNATLDRIGDIFAKVIAGAASLRSHT